MLPGTLLSEPLAPGEVDERLMSSFCVKLHRAVWSVFKRDKSLTLPKDQPDSEVSLPMLHTQTESKPNAQHDET